MSTSDIRQTFNSTLKIFSLISIILLAPQDGLTAEMTGALANDIARTYGFYLGQKYRLEKIEETHPKLSSRAKKAQGEFDIAFHGSIKNLDLAMYEIGKQWDDIKKTLEDRTQSAIDGNTMSEKQAETFILEVEGRAKGKIESPIIETLLMYKPSYAKNPVSEFIEGYQKRYEADGKGKAKGVKFHIDYPKSWLAKEGNRPNIVKKFKSENGHGFETVMIIIKKIPSEAGGVISEEEINEMATPAELKKLLPPNSSFISGGLCRIDNRPGFYQRFTTNERQMTYDFVEEAIIYTIFCLDRMIQIQGMVIGVRNEAVDVRIRFERYKPLFVQIANSLVIKSQWLDSQ